MPILRNQFRFNKAGQGCFYTGWLNTTNRTFSFVYDCGTRSTDNYIQNEIHLFHNNLRHRCDENLNILIISHFDVDHVNKIRALLAGIRRVDYIILPYLNPFQRLLVLLGQDDVDPDFLAFIQDPVGFLSSSDCEIGNIIFIKGDGSPEDNLEPIVFQSPVLDTNEFSVNYSELEDQDPEEEYKFRSPLVRFVGDKGRLFVNRFWEFYFFNKPINQVLLQDLVQAFNHNFPILFQGEAFVQEQAMEIFSDENINAIKQIYRNVLGNHNLNHTSLMVLHGACSINNREQTRLIFGNHYHRKYRIDSASYTLLMGDMYLHGLVFPNYLIKQRNRIAIVQIPHHGAATHWDFPVLTNLIHGLVISVINFGLGNPYKHPREVVVNDLRNQGWKIKLNHQLKFFRYSIFLHY